MKHKPCTEWSEMTTQEKVSFLTDYAERLNGFIQYQVGYIKRCRMSEKKDRTADADIAIEQKRKVTIEYLSAIHLRDKLLNRIATNIEDQYSIQNVPDRFYELRHYGC